MCLLLTLPSANNVTTTNCLISYSTLHSIYILINRNSGNHISTFFPSHYNQMTNITFNLNQWFCYNFRTKNNYGQREPHFCQIDKFKSIVILYRFIIYFCFFERRTFIFRTIPHEQKQPSTCECVSLIILFLIKNHISCVYATIFKFTCVVSQYIWITNVLNKKIYQKCVK